MSERFEAIKALMEDPLNLACFLKIWQGKDVTLISPPMGEDGLLGWVPFRELLKLGPGEVPSEGSFIMSIFFDGRGWFVSLPGGEEVGPFDAKNEAEGLALRFARNKGWTILSDIPW